MNQFAGVLTSATDAVASALDTRTTGTRGRRLQPAEHRARGRRRGDRGLPRRRAEGGARRRAGRQGGAGAARPPRARSSSWPRSRRSASPSTTCQPADGAGSPRRLKVTRVVARERALPRDAQHRTATSPASSTRALNKELLSAPARLEIKTDNPRNWPAWNMDFEDQTRRAARLRPGAGEDPHRRERPGARRARDHARDRRLDVRADDPAVGRRRRQPRRVRQRHRLDDEGSAPQGGLPADRVEPRSPPTTGTSARSSGPRTTSGSSRSPRTSGST